MNPIDLMKRPAAYACGYENAPVEAQRRAKQLCWTYNQTSPEDAEKRRAILRELLGTYHPLTNIESDFRCDYGFNIHVHGLAVINYNCMILDTSPARGPLSRRVSAWPVPATPLIRNSAAAASAPPRPSRWRTTSGSAPTPPSAAV